MRPIVAENTQWAHNALRIIAFHFFTESVMVLFVASSHVELRGKDTALLGFGGTLGLAIENVLSKLSDAEILSAAEALGIK